MDASVQRISDMMYEYTIVHIEKHVNDVLDEYGRQGWELCAIAPDGQGFYFKRMMSKEIRTSRERVKQPDTGGDPTPSV